MMENDVGTAFVALGANLFANGLAPRDSVPAAMKALSVQAEGPVRCSRLYRTPAFPAGAGPDFVNAAMALPWRGSARDLLEVLHGIEAEFGRTRTNRWEARVMDLDLIGLDDQILPDPATRAEWAALSPQEAAQVVPDQLILPHPRLQDRGFVLVPLADVAPDWVDPATGLSVAQMVAALSPEALAEIRPLSAGE